MALLTELGCVLAAITNVAFFRSLRLAPALWEAAPAMANTYTRIYIQIVFAVQGRQNLIRPERKEELQKYMTGTVTRQGQKLIAIHCMPDHTHLLIGLRPNIALSDLLGDIKTGSTNHINEQRWVPGRFSWQEGFGAFSYSHSQLTRVIDYIRDQVKHHAHKSFREEYLAFLKRYAVPHDQRYIFQPVEEEE
jgi:putative transposase